MLLLSGSAIAQVSEDNSLRTKQKYYQKKETQSIPQLLARARVIRTSNPEQAIELVREAIISARSRKDGESHLFEAYKLLAEINEDLKQWALAATNYEKTMNYTSSDKGGGLDKEIHFKLGECRRKEGNTIKAISAFQKYQGLANTPSEKFKVNTAMGDSYYANQQPDEALEHYLLAEQWAVKSGNRIDISLAKANIAKILAVQNKVVEAELLLEESEGELLDLAVEIEQDQISDDEVYGNYYTDFTPVNTARDEVVNNLDSTDFKKEIEIRQNAIYFNNSVNEITSGNSAALTIRPSTNANTYSWSENPVAIENRKLAQVYVDQGDYESGIDQIETTLTFTATSDVSEEKAKSLKLYSEVLSKQGKFEQSLEKYELYVLEMEKIVLQKENELEQIARLVSKQRDLESAEKDLEIFEKESSIYEKDGELTAERYEQQRAINWLLLFLLGVGCVVMFIIYRNSKEKRRSNELLALKSLRSQMNPHFIFNALNSVNSFISKNDERSANKFLSEFSKLMRMVLENSHEDFVSLTQELAVIQLYVKLEHYRFRDKFDYTYNLDDSIDAEHYDIPPMLIQPFIENAVWHGLRYKEEFGKMSVDIYEKNRCIIVEIKDDGIGREKSRTLKTKNQNQQSKGLKNTEERLKLINKLYKKNYQLSISDLDPESTDAGTHVKLILPLGK